MVNLRSIVSLLLLLILSFEGQSAETIHQVVQRGDVEATRQMLIENPKAWDTGEDYVGDTPAGLAVHGGYLEILKLFVANGYDLNPSQWYQHPARLLDPYVGAAEPEHLEILQWITPQVNSNPELGFLLFSYIECDHVEGAQILLEHGVNPNAQIQRWSSALDLAESESMTALLKEYGASSYQMKVIIVIGLITALLGLLLFFFSKRKKSRLKADTVHRQPEHSRGKGNAWVIFGLVASLIGFGIVLAIRYGSVFGLSRPDTATAAMMVVVGLALASFGMRCIVKGRKLASVDGEQIIRDHKRPMVLYLRSFGLDVEDGKNKMPIYMGVSVPVNPWESSLALAFSKVADMIAIGKPGEKFATTGAARVYVTDDQWKDKVIEMLAKSDIAVWTYGATEGLKWEISRLVESITPDKLVIALPVWKLKTKARAQAWKELKENIGHVFPKALPDEIGQSLFVTFDSEWNACAVQPLPTHMMIRAAMLFGRNHIIEGVNGLLKMRGYTWPGPGWGTFIGCFFGFSAWVSVLGVILVLLYGLIQSFF